MPLLEDLEDIGERKSKEKAPKKVIKPIIVDVNDDKQSESNTDSDKVLLKRVIGRGRHSSTDDIFVA